MSDFDTSSEEDLIFESFEEDDHPSTLEAELEDHDHRLHLYQSFNAWVEASSPCSLVVSIEDDTFLVTLELDSFRILSMQGLSNEASSLLDIFKFLCDVGDLEEVKLVLLNRFSNFEAHCNGVMDREIIVPLNVHEDIDLIIALVRDQPFMDSSAPTTTRLCSFINFLLKAEKICCINCGRVINRSGICSSELCTQSYTLNPRYNCIDRLMIEEPEVVELMYTLLRETVRSRRCLDLLKPMNPRYVTEEGHVCSEIQGVLNVWHPKCTDKNDPFFSLLWWIVARQRLFGRLTKIDGKSVGHPNKLVFEYHRYGDPVIDNGQLAHHGSHTENWISIMQNGIVPLSGTKHMLFGAAFGKGVYLSPNYNTSLMYAGGSKKIVALCRIDAEHKASPHFVINEENAVKITHLVVD